MNLSYEELEKKYQETLQELADIKKALCFQNQSENKYLFSDGNDITEQLKIKQSFQQNFDELFAIFNGFEGSAHVVDLANYKILAANKYTEKIYGENLVGDLCYKRYHPGFYAPCPGCKNNKLLDENGDPKEPVFSEFLNPVNGKWFQCVDRAIRWPDGRMVKMQVAVDISDWKKFANELHLSEEKYKKLVSNLPDIVVVHKDDRIIFINDKISYFTSYPTEYFIGKNFFDFIHEDDKKTVHEIHTKRLLNEPTPEFYEIRIKTAGNEYLNMEIRRTIIDYAGEKAILNVLTNVTDTKKAKEALKHTQDQYYQLVENAVDAIFHGDTKGNFIGVNPRATEMTGYSKEELLTMNMGQLFTPDQVTARPLRYDLLQQGFTIRTERLVTRKDGSKLPVEMNTKMMPDKTYQSFFRDFSERMKMEDELLKAKEKAEESDRLKSAFLANMSHEIRTPLNGILGFTDILINENIEENKHKEFLEIINTNGKQLLAIINDIIDISRIEAGQVKINSAKCFLNQLMFEIFNIFNTVLLEKIGNNVKINLKIPSERSILIYTDDVRIRQVLNNLIGNAVKFTHNGTIEIGYTIDVEKYIIQFFVRDSGIGLSKGQQSIIFERFRQADDTTTRNYGGTGLGLAISKGLVELMGGKIWVESDENIGSVFYFTIPFNPVIVNELVVESEKPILKKYYNWSDKTILVVEDDDDSYLYLETLLERNKATIIHAENGFEAVKICTQNKKISLVLMDIQTPVMNGIEATKKIRKFDKVLPIIAQTANAFSEDREKCIAAGCNDYVMKPIEVKSLFILIDSVFEKSR